MPNGLKIKSLHEVVDEEVEVRLQMIVKSPLTPLCQEGKKIPP
jgi:hypothetical protein